MRLTRIIATTVAAAALVVPAAQAAVPPDMHGPAAIALTKSHQTKQDLRSPDARDAATPRLHRSGALVVVPRQPTWPVNPKPIQAVAPAAPAPSDDGIDWTTIAIGIAGSLLAVGAVALMASRRHTRPLRPSV